MKGFHDTYGVDIEYWHKAETAIKELCKTYNIKEFRLPILEKTSTFKRGIGETTDIVEKEMFTFIDSEEQVSLRPEGTASLIRAYVENNLAATPGVKKYYYLGNMFRRERPQKGRFRQFTQIGVEALECDSPLIDAEIINLLYNAAKVTGISELANMEINSIGCDTCRPAYREKMIAYFSDKKEELCADCNRRLEKNPLRILDCKNEKCKTVAIDAPLILDYLCEECDTHFTSVKKYLDVMGTPYTINKRMVRGLDYYIRTAFELVTDKLGAASAIGAGGRYNGLIKQMGGKDSAGIGFAIGLDRFVALMKEMETLEDQKADVFFISFDDNGVKITLDMVRSLRESNVIAEYDYDIASMKSQMKKADRSGAKFAVILGEDELSGNNATVRALDSGEQKLMPLAELTEFLLNNIKK